MGMRYHSLIGHKELFPNCLEITAYSTDDQEIMAVKHREFSVFGMQFHPESILTEHGHKLLTNFLKLC